MTTPRLPRKSLPHILILAPAKITPPTYRGQAGMVETATPGAHALALHGGPAFRRTVPQHRLCALELHELGNPARRGGDAVQGALAHPAPARRVEPAVARVGRVDRAVAGPALPQPRLLPGNGGYRLSEHPCHPRACPDRIAGAGGQSPLPHELRAPDR